MAPSLMFSVAKAPLPLTVEALMAIAPLLMAGRFFFEEETDGKTNRYTRNESERNDDGKVGLHN